ncbi:adenosylcobinamide-phosphate synthase CbiB, partial [Desulfobacterales bacterium HSG16]|nr:adenosylcobinamide-phosphate synthase CbiB [Desulfobacterales bacterium HSG16]
MDIHSGPYALLAAFILDFLIGDPRFLPHPIRWMGTAIEKAEPEFRKFVANPLFAGLLFAISLITATWFAAWFCLFIAFKIHPSLKYVMEIVMIYYAISASSLETEAKKVYNLLKKEDTEKARQNLAMIVGRDVEGLSKEEISRATIETVAENLVDGFISPMFFAVLGGAPLAMAYKMVNTLDSMVGYKNKDYIDFGKAAARIDDAANYIPARI